MREIKIYITGQKIKKIKKSNKKTSPDGCKMADNYIGVVDECCLGWRTGGKCLHSPTYTFLSAFLFFFFFRLSHSFLYSQLNTYHSSFSLFPPRSSQRCCCLITSSLTVHVSHLFAVLHTTHVFFILSDLAAAFP